MIDVLIYVLIVYSIGIGISVIPLKKFVNKYYPDHSNVARSLAAYRLAVAWPLLAIVATHKAIINGDISTHRRS